MRDTRFPALVYDKQHDFEIQNSVNRTPVVNFMKEKMKSVIGWCQRKLANQRTELLRAPSEAFLCDALPLSDGDIRYKKVLVDGIWDNPNYWLRFRLFQSAIGFSSDSCVGIIGKWTEGRCEKVLARLGIRDIRDHRAILSKSKKSICDEARVVAESCGSGKGILNLKLPHNYHGDYIYDTIIKKLRLPTIADEPWQRWLEPFIEAYVGIYEAEAVLDQIQPDLLVLSHPIGDLDGPLSWLATQRKIPVIVLFSLYLRNAFAKYNSPEEQWVPLDIPSGSELDNLSDGRKREMFCIGETYLDRRRQGQTTDLGAQYAYGARGWKKNDESTRKLFSGSQKKIVSVFASNWFDFPHWCGLNNFEDLYVWIKETLEVAIESDHCNWLFRGHPCDAWYGGITLRSLFEQYDLPSHVKICPEEIGTVTVLEESDAFITLQGTVGIEATALGKPVLAADKWWNNDCGFVRSCLSRGEYLETLKTEWWKDWDTEKAAERAQVCAGIYFGLPNWQKEFIQEDDSVQWDIYKRMPAMLERAKDEIEIEKECIRRWWASDHRFFHTWKMLNCYECLPEIEPENRF